MAEPQKERDPVIDLLNLPESKRRQAFGALSPEDAQGVLEYMSTKGNPYTEGQRYRFRREAGLLPKGEVTSFTTNPRQALAETAVEAGNVAQQYQYEASKPGRSFVSQLGQGTLSAIAESIGVGAKVGGALADPKNLAAFVISKLGPYGQVAAAQYFGLQSSQALSDAISTGKITPENLQNALLAGAGIAGAAGLGAEGGRAQATPETATTPASIKARLQPAVRQAVGVTGAVREAVRKEAEAFPEKEQANRAARVKAMRENAEARKAQLRKDDLAKIAVQQKNAQIQEENAARTAERAGIVSQREQGLQASETQATAAKQSIDQVETKVWQEANRKFEALKDRVKGTGQPAAGPQTPEDRVLTAVAQDPQGAQRNTVTLEQLSRNPALQDMTPDQIRTAATNLWNSGRVFPSQTSQVGSQGQLNGIALRPDTVLPATGGGGGEIFLDSGPLLQAVNEAQTNVLQGIPENLPQFKAILKLDEEAGPLQNLRDAAAQGFGFADYASVPDQAAPNSPPGAPTPRQLVDQRVQTYGGAEGTAAKVGWDKLQRLKTNIDAAVRKSSTPPIIKRALRGVNDKVVDMMGEIANRKGAGAQWQEARDFYRQWREDFHTPTGPKGSASPVSEVMQAVDPKYIQQALGRTFNEGTGTNRAVDILRKYPQYGGTEAATAVEQAVRTQRSVPKQPGALKLKEAEPMPEVFPQPKPKEVPGKIENPRVNATTESRSFLEQRSKAWTNINKRDVGIIVSSVIAGPLMRMLLHAGGRETGEGASMLLPAAAFSYEVGSQVIGRALINPSIMSWLERTPPEEIQAIRQIPGADRVTIIEGLTSAAEQSARAGRPVNLSPAVQEFIGPGNVKRIAAAGGAAKPPQNRREAIESLRRHTVQ